MLPVTRTTKFRAPRCTSSTSPLVAKASAMSSKFQVTRSVQATECRSRMCSTQRLETLMYVLRESSSIRLPSKLAECTLLRSTRILTCSSTSVPIAYDACLLAHVPKPKIMKMHDWTTILRTEQRHEDASSYFSIVIMS